MDMKQRGSTTINVSVSPPTRERPRGGVYNRLEKLLKYKRETWDEVIERLLDFYEANMDDGK